MNVSPALDHVLNQLVVGNRILADHGVVDAFGHLSVRHPERPHRFFMSCSKAPASIERGDLIEFDLDCNPIDDGGRAMYAERQIHGAIYRARPEVHSVCHNHSKALIPFGVTDAELRPLSHMGASMGPHVGVWDIAEEFGDTSMLVTTAPMGNSLARALGSDSTMLMRGHGSVVAGISIQDTVFRAIYTQFNAELQVVASHLGTVRYLTPNEVTLAAAANATPLALNRAWNEWCARVGMPV